MFTPGRFQTRYAKLVAIFVGSAITLLVVVTARDTSMEAQVTALLAGQIQRTN